MGWVVWADNMGQINYYLGKLYSLQDTGNTTKLMDMINREIDREMYLHIHTNIIKR